jgi:hypothetical protein
MSSSFYEAWCPHCRVTHPPGTRRCLHCGGPVLSERPSEAGSAVGPVLRTGPSAWPPPADAEDDAAETSRVARPMRIGMAAIWILLAIGTAIVRACTERG